MTTQTATMDSRPANRGRSIGAVLLGLVVVVALSMGTDHVLHVTGVYPPYGVVMEGTGLYLLALGYRVVFQIFGCYLTARFAPRNPMKHAWIGGFIGLGLGTLGAILSIVADMGPSWYPIVLALSALPCAWIGGTLYSRRSGA